MLNKINLQSLTEKNFCLNHITMRENNLNPKLYRQKQNKCPLAPHCFCNTVFSEHREIKSPKEETMR